MMVRKGYTLLCVSVAQGIKRGKKAVKARLTAEYALKRKHGYDHSFAPRNIAKLHYLVGVFKNVPWLDLNRHRLYAVFVYE